MNEGAYGCFGCKTDSSYTPISFDGLDLFALWDSLGFMAQGAITIAAVLLLSAAVLRDSPL